MTCVCSKCQEQLDNQSISLHNSLVEINHVHNNTLYECKECFSQIALVSVPHSWQLVASGPESQVA